MNLLAKILAGLKALVRRLGLMPQARRLAGFLLRRGSGPLNYFLRKAIEQANYAAVEEVHDLPPIHGYWANRYLLPKVRAFGFEQAEEFFANHVRASLPAGRAGRIFSIGSGNCDTEVRVAALLKGRGVGDFVIECLDLNPAMLARGRELAIKQGVAGQIAFTQGDFNRWEPVREYDAVIASQALHHVLELEQLYDSIHTAIGTSGRLIVSDMIGRNGHRRWPEALAIVEEFWRELPPAYRYNRLLGRREERFDDWDHSVSGFEGIRAQDILPLMADRFRFEVFLPFACVIDPFIDRAYGPNFDPRKDWDRAFIDRVHSRDEAEILAGRIKPTHMFAVVSQRGAVAPQLWSGLRPEACVRRP